jgi:serine protease Do
MRDRVHALARGESVQRPRLGIAVAPAGVARRQQRSVGLPERDGLLVRGVEDGSPAAIAGIRDGDLIVEAGGRSVADPDVLHEILVTAGLPLELKVVRGTEERTVSVGGAEAAGEA